jgi:hypothetical protein
MKETGSKALRVVAAGFTLRLPTETPYDRQLSAEHVAALLKRHGALRLSTGRQASRLTLTTASKSANCPHCLRPLQRAVRLNDREVVCVACAAHSVISPHGQRERSAA